MERKLMYLTENELKNIRESNIDDYVIAKVCNTFKIDNDSSCFDEIMVTENFDGDFYLDFFNAKDGEYYDFYLKKISEFPDRCIYEIEQVI